MCGSCDLPLKTRRDTTCQALSSCLSGPTSRGEAVYCSWLTWQRQKRLTRQHYLSAHSERRKQTDMALFMGRDVIASGQVHVWVPGTIWGGTRTCSTGDNTSLGRRPITTETTQATPCRPVLLTSERDWERKKKIDRHCKKYSAEMATLARLRILITLIIAGMEHSYTKQKCLFAFFQTYSHNTSAPPLAFQFCSTVLSYYEEKQNEQSDGGLWNGVMTDCCALLGCTACTCSKLKPFQISLAEKWDGAMLCWLL